MFNIIARKTLLGYIRQYPDAKTALEKWYAELLYSEFKNYNELKKKYPGASIVDDDRVVFNISGNKYRLVVRIIFEFKAIQVKWFGTHSEYDKINVETVKFKKNENSNH
ncbi:MAG: type II toxin-antitoxin system HigB family toxin [Bacteroidia bacterium]|nr:type II toxin-antitoxin system HigB family toxin [Bacteroidia bacterium]